MVWGAGLTAIDTLYVGASDFSVVWAGARGLVDAQNPYDMVGPGRPHPWAHTLLYPFTAVLVGVPFALMPLWAASATFSAAGAGLMAWGLTRERLNDPRLLVFLSLPFAHAAVMSQWSPLLVGAALVPAFSWILPCKPTIGIPLFLWQPTRQRTILCAVMVVASLVIWPTWPVSWLMSTASVAHITAPVLQPWGWLLLTPLVFWRHPPARFVAVIACLPQSPYFYEAVILFLIVRTWSESAVLWLAMVVAVRYVPVDATIDTNNLAQLMAGWAPKMMLGGYLPAAAIVIRQGWMDRQWRGRSISRAH